MVGLTLTLSDPSLSLAWQVVTAPGGSAEVIPFLKTWVNLPGAVLFTLGYSALSNRMGGQALFYTMLSPFLAFFGSFAAIIYPMRDVLHPNQFCDFLLSIAPAGTRVTSPRTPRSPFRPPSSAARILQRSGGDCTEITPRSHRDHTEIAPRSRRLQSGSAASHRPA